MPVTLVLADDHPIILDALENLFRSERDFEVVARCTTGDETLEAVRKHQPDVLVLDIRMPETDGLDVLREMKKQKITSRVVILTAGLDDHEVLDAIRLGVSGFVLKEMAPEALVECIRKVHAGGRWLERTSLQQAMEKALVFEEGARQIAEILTRREIEITRLVAGGLRNRDIAKKLFISEGTVKIHLHRIYEKLNVDSRLALSLYARDRGLA
jgi:DNA-binding NarL/FixJ family response regulator